MLKNRPTLCIVLSCYNEKPEIEEKISQLMNVLTELIREKCVSDKSFLLFINDSSLDHIWEMINQHQERNPSVVELKLDPKVGYKNALLDSLMHAKELADCVISIDIDLLDHMRFIREFVVCYLEEYELGVRESSSKYIRFKRNLEFAFYRLMKWMGIKVNQDHSTHKQEREHI
ncbi:glycosyltransferase [Paenibacillus etheri]|uniref:Glycosyltransferase 2-like domain-containing protein n=1 Tax=Paenibacillus etheri TaxID=1306852 RepID=A0A0W1AQB8_9BACL|nr:glycosyltransferase [Paenibacillus etheri]KTD83531.1 hypothetical protein UQ64_01395 [Paenibacillus etheri]